MLDFWCIFDVFCPGSQTFLKNVTKRMEFPNIIRNSEQMPGACRRYAPRPGRFYRVYKIIICYIYLLAFVLRQYLD